MPVYNAAPYLVEALASVRDQSFSDFELVAIDDGSTDGSVALLESFAKHEARMRVMTRQNRGVIYTRNELLAEARGEFVAWMDADDLSHRKRLERQIAAFHADPTLVCVGSNTQLIDPDGNPLAIETYPECHQEIIDEQKSGGGLRFASTMQRRSVALCVGGFREPFRLGEDLDYLLRVTEYGKAANLPDCLYFYRQHLMSTCVGLGSAWPAYREVILSLAKERAHNGNDRLQRGEIVSVPPVTPQDARSFIPAVLVGWARDALANGDVKRAWRYLWSALQESPRNRRVWAMGAKIILELMSKNSSFPQKSRTQSELH